MSGLTVAEIQEQEEEIFSGQFDQLNYMVPGNQQARMKALQQLAVSDDSPFNFAIDCQQEQSRQQMGTGGNDNRSRDREDEEGLKKLMEEKARLLRDETEEIKRQLDLVRSQINELHHKQPEEDTGETSRKTCNHHLDRIQPQSSPDQPIRDVVNGGQQHKITFGEKRHEFVKNQQLTSADSQFSNRNITSGEGNDEDDQKLKIDPKLRPLTGKTDCPNCACDRRRSVCDKCMELQLQKVVHQEITGEVIKRHPTFITEQQISNIISTSEPHGNPRQHSTRRSKSIMTYRDYDERPIRPAKQKLEELLGSQNINTEAPINSRGSKITRTHGDESVNQVVVPSKLYTIGKSLNDKRTKLAQAIEDLQLMMGKVKKRGERLEQERKVAQLYKGQWKFGPSIGGGGSTSSLAAVGRRGSNESLRGGVASCYTSRLDPNLSRDSNSMMGFQHVEPSVRHLRQFGSRSHKQQNTRHQQQTPRPKPRLSILNNSRISAQASNLHKRPTQSSILHSRSKSIESLHKQTKSSPPPRRRLPTASERLQTRPEGSETSVGAKNNFNFHAGKSSSELDLASSSDRKSSPEKCDEDDEDSSAAIEENLEIDEIHEDEENAASEKSRPKSRSPSNDSIKGRTESFKSPENMVESESRSENGLPLRNDFNLNIKSGHQNQSSKPKEETSRGVWVPILGDTEIKTIDRRPTQRNFMALNPNSRVAQATSVSKSILRKNNQPSSTNKRSTALNDRVLNEATKKLQFATDLLERERYDSKNTNQLNIVRTQPLARPRSTTSAVAQRELREACKTPMTTTTTTTNDYRQPVQARVRARPVTSGGAQSTTSAATPDQSAAQNVNFGANKEITRLEEMISEQQALLLKLTQSNNLRSSPACCHHHSSTPCQGADGGAAAVARATSNCNIQAKHINHQPARQLVNNLRDRLNKTKARLARTLEEERAKHEQLEQKVDSSLRKQSDLENENELLKKSLSKCIDTCLRDISSTFESLSDTLSESIDMEPPQQTSETLNAPSGGGSSGNVSPLLNNAAQLIADNRHLKRMKSHIDTIESQRRTIFEQLNQERRRSQQLEAELRQSKLELEQLTDAKRRLETHLDNHDVDAAEAAAAVAAVTTDAVTAAIESEPTPSTSKQDNYEGQHSSHDSGDDANHPAKQTKLNENQKPRQQQQQHHHFSDCNSCSLMTTCSTTEDTTTSMTYNSIDTYRQYIQSMTPDLDAIRRERRMILDEFDNIKRMLSDMDNN